MIVPQYLTWSAGAIAFYVGRPNSTAPIVTRYSPSAWLPWTLEKIIIRRQLGPAAITHHCSSLSVIQAHSHAGDLILTFGTIRQDRQHERRSVIHAHGYELPLSAIRLFFVAFHVAVASPLCRSAFFDS